MILVSDGSEVKTGRRIAALERLLSIPRWIFLARFRFFTFAVQ
jgi:hypothetical protein